MRGKKSVLNAITSLLFEVIKMIGAFLIPIFVLNQFGSSTNGINQSINQFIGYISLLTAGIGSVSTAALYKPLSDKNTTRISEIVNATQSFLRRTSLLFLIGLLLLAFLYPIIIKDFNYLFTFTLVLILGIGTFINYYFGLAYTIILNADQKQYIVNVIRMVVFIIHMVTTIILIKSDFGIHTVQLVGSLIFMSNPIIIYFYVNKKYKIDKMAQPDFNSISQRWDAFSHQIARFIHYNTDVVLLSIFSNLKEVSVFTVHQLVFSGIRTIISSLISGNQSALGDMFVKGEQKNINKTIKMFELFLHFISIVFYTTAAVLISSFIQLYTKGIHDANYNRIILGYLLAVVGFFEIARIPYESISNAAGHFKQTRNGAIIEVFLNVSLSIILVIPFGMEGLIIATLVATIFRTLQYGIYSSKNLLDRSFNVIIKRYLVSIINIVVIIVVAYFTPLLTVNNYFDWIINGIIVTSIGIIITTIFSLIFYFNDFINIKNFILRIFRKKKTTNLN